MSTFSSYFLTTVLLLCLTPTLTAAVSEEERLEIKQLKLQQAELQAKTKLLRLKHVLELEPQQMEAWEIYKKQVITASGKLPNLGDKLRKQYRESDKKPSSLELAKVNISRLEFKLEKAKQKYENFAVFYEVLNNKQKALIDKYTLRKIKKEAKKARMIRQREMKERSKMIERKHQQKRQQQREN